MILTDAVWGPVTRWCCDCNGNARALDGSWLDHDPGCRGRAGEVVCQGEALEPDILGGWQEVRCTPCVATDVDQPVADKVTRFLSGEPMSPNDVTEAVLALAFVSPVDGET